jgi:hypothetical protein
MRKLAMFVAAIAILSVGALIPTKAEAGCYLCVPRTSFALIC